MEFRLFSGKDFNKKYNYCRFYKLLHEDLTHFGLVYEDGINDDVYNFNPNYFSKGGLFFTELNKIPYWYNNSYVYIAKITIPNYANVCVYSESFKADILIVDIENKVRFCDFEYWNDPYFCEISVRQNGYFIKYVVNQYIHLCKIAIKHHITNYEHIREKTQEISDIIILHKYNMLSRTNCTCFNENSMDKIYKVVIKEYPYSLKYFNEQTEEICKYAVSIYGLSLQFVKIQTEEICKLAVKQNGMSLMFVKEQTDEICKLAVCQNGFALRYVKKQTDEICKRAIRQNYFSSMYVKNNNLIQMTN